MPFQIKDLMIDVSPAQGYQARTDLVLCRWGCTFRYPTFHCRWACSFHPTYVTCGFGRTDCGPTVDFGPTFDCGGPYITDTPRIVTETIATLRDPREFAQLKDDLRKTLELIEKQEVALAEEMTPKTLEDVNMLEAKLSEALKAVQDQKAQLQKRK
jgi:hypothetical protein